MGRETIATVTYRGITAEAKVLLETTELILRGGHKERFPRDNLRDVAATPQGLDLNAGGEPLHVAMSEIEARRWAKAILTPPPSLASKLGIGPDKPALVLGAVEDAALAESLAGATSEAVGSATQIIAMIENTAALDAALARSRETRLPLWCVYPKGRSADPGDMAIRTALRAAGMIDSKTCAVSERLTATRYGWPKG
jgi:hypothetical protein